LGRQLVKRQLPSPELHSAVDSQSVLGSSVYVYGVVHDACMVSHQLQYICGDKMIMIMGTEELNQL